MKKGIIHIRKSLSFEWRHGQKTFKICYYPILRSNGPLVVDPGGLKSKSRLNGFQYGGSVKERPHLRRGTLHRHRRCRSDLFINDYGRLGQKSHCKKFYVKSNS